MRSSGSVDVLPLGVYPRPDPLPLSCMQKWWWEFEQVSGPVSHTLSVLPLRRQLDYATLDRTLGEVVRRHEVLRTRFTSAGGSVIPTIDPPERFSSEFVDYSLLPEKSREAAAAELHEQYRGKTYQLDGGALFRMCLLRIEHNLHFIFIGAHHILLDGPSHDILHTQLRALYAAFAAGKRCLPPAPDYQFADFAIWEQHWLRSESGADPYSYWEGRLRNMPPLELPGDFPRQRDRRGKTSGARHEFEIRGSDLTALQELARRCGTTLQVTLLSVYSLILAKWSGRAEFIVGNYMHGRDFPELGQVLGCFSSNRPIHIVVAHGSGFIAHLKNVHRAFAAARDLRKPISMRLSLEKRLNAVIINFMKKSNDTVASADLARFEPHDPKPVGHDLALVLHETPAALRVIVSYAANLFLPERIEAFCEDFRRLAAAVCRDPERVL
jgi:hypothetical protein